MMVKIEETLGNIITHKKGHAFKSAWFQEEGYPIVKVTNFTDNSISADDLVYINENIYNEKNEYILNKDDVVVQTVGSWPNNPDSVVGKVVKVPKVLNGALLNQNAVILKPREDYNHLFFYYLLKSDNFKGYIINTAQGAANQASITLDSIYRYKFYKTPLQVQRKIAAILSPYDDLIENNNRRIAILEKMAEELHREWFVRFRFPGHESVNVIKGVPEGWDVKKIGELVISNPLIKIDKNTELQHIAMEDVSPGKKYPNLKDGRKTYSGGAKFSSGDTIFARITPCLENGKIAMIRSNIEIGFGSTEFFVFRAREGVATTNFIYYLLRTELVRNTAISSMTGASGRQRAAIFSIENMLTILPPMKILVEFEKQINIINSFIEFKLDDNKRLSKIRDRLLGRLMSGKIDVENLDIRFPESMQEGTTNA